MGNAPSSKDWKPFMTPASVAAAIAMAIPAATSFQDKVAAIREVQVRQDVILETLKAEQSRIIEEQKQLRAKLDELLRRLEDRKIVNRIVESSNFAGDKNESE